MSSRFTKLMSKNLFSLLAAMGLALTAGCSGTVYTSGSVGYYPCEYYPDCDVYYYPNDRVYYWNDGRHWRSGHAVPREYPLSMNNREHYQMQTRQPWTEHQSTRPEFQGHYAGVGHERR